MKEIQFQKKISNIFIFWKKNFEKNSQSDSNPDRRISCQACESLHHSILLGVENV